MEKIRLFAPPEIVQRLRTAIEVRVFGRDGMPALIEGRWDENFQALQYFHQEHGHLDVPPDLRVNGIGLYSWLHKQRRYARLGRLRADRLERLKILGFVASLIDVRWDENFQALQYFHQEHGHLDVPPDLRVNGIVLRSWLHKQRRDARLGRLRADRLERLKTLGFAASRFAERWEEGFREYEQFWLANGHGRVPDFHVTSGGVHLGKWVSNQRDEAKNGKLNAERRERLTAAGVCLQPARRGLGAVTMRTRDLPRDKRSRECAQDIQNG
jgi:hypothetical protein